jgi:hypothetical protein
MLHKDCFIDLPEIELPFTYKDILTDLDYEILETKISPNHNAKSENILWFGQQSEINTNIRAREVSLLGMITNLKILDEIKHFTNKVFRKGIIEHNTYKTGKVITGVTLITFSQNTPWHREGFNPEWTSPEYEEKFHTAYPFRRFNYAINFPLYTVNSDTTKVEFARLKSPIGAIEQNLHTKLLDNNSLEEQSQGVKMSPALDQITDEKKWQNHIEVLDTKHKYDCPYIINLSSYHKVHTTDATRLSLRLMGSHKYCWRDIETFYTNGQLLN